MDDQLRQEAEAIQNLELDVQLWETLAHMSPQAVSQSALASYDRGLSSYSIQVLSEAFEVSPKDRIIRKVAEPTAKLSIESRLLILQYLTHARDLSLARKWVSEKELKNGEMFFRGVHSLDIFRKHLEERFGHSPDTLLAVGRSFGGIKANLGDVGIQFRVLPRIPLLYVLWAGDDEFPAKANILFDPTIESHLALDTIWGMVRVVTFRLLDL